VVSDAKQHEHQTDTELHRQAKARFDDPVEQDYRCADESDGDRVADPPPHTNPCRRTHEALAADRRGDRGDVIGIGRVPHSEKKSERDRRAEGHGVAMAACICCLMMSLMRNRSVSTARR
jgi:hypothetical protein